MYNITTSTNIIIIISNNSPPITPPIILVSKNVGLLSSAEDNEDRVIHSTGRANYLLVAATQVKLPSILLHFTEVPSSFTSSHTCSLLPLTL